MALYRYFASVDSLPSPRGPLSRTLSPATISDVNKAVMDASKTQRSKPRGKYAKLTPEQQAEIGKYASMHGNAAAIRHFSKELDTDLKEGSVRSWKSKYQAEVNIKRQLGEADTSVTRLTLKKTGRPLMLGEKLDGVVKHYIRAVREGGGVITTAITMAAATAIVRRADRNLLSENGGPIDITVNWAKSLLYRMGFVKRRGSTAMKMTVTNFERIKEQFLLDIQTVVEMEDVPMELVFNWDQTGISIVPGSTWTMELKGSKRVEITGISDKRQVTAVFCGTLAGDFLPPQLIYQGKTSACLPRHKFPNDWHITCTPNHWSNEEKMKEYLKEIFTPYVQQKRQELGLPPNQAALALFDVFKGQQTESITSILEANNIIVVPIPANCTDQLQPMDLSLNKAAKDFMRQKFREWYATEVQKQLDDGATLISPVDLRMSVMKPLGSRWLVSLYDYIRDHKAIVQNGFKAAGILQVCNSSQ